MRCGEPAADGVRLERQQCDRHIPLPPEWLPLNPTFMRIPGVSNLLLLLWRVKMVPFKRGTSAWPTDIGVALMELDSGTLIPHNVPFDAVPFTNVNLVNLKEVARGRNQTVAELFEGRKTFLSIDATYCLKTKDLRPVWWRNQLYLLTTHGCGNEREVLVPFHLTMSRDAQGSVRRWRAWVSFSEPRYFIVEPRPDPQPSFGDYIEFDDVSRGSRRPQPPSRLEKNWAVLSVPSTNDSHSLFMVRHLCPLTALRSFTLQGVLPPTSDLLEVSDVPLNMPMRIVDTAPVDAITKLTGKARPHELAACTDWYTSEHADLATRNPMHVYPPFTERNATSTDTLSERPTECTVAPLHVNATADPHWYLDIPACLRHELHGRAWRGGSDMVHVLPRGRQKDAESMLFLGSAHIKVWQSDHVVAFYYHFFYVLRVVHSPMRNASVSLLSASRLFRFHQRRAPAREFNTGVLRVSSDTVLLTYGQGVRGDRAFVAFVSTDTIERMLHDTIEFGAFDRRNEEHVESSSLSLNASYESDIFTQKWGMAEQIDIVPRKWNRFTGRD